MNAWHSNVATAVLSAALLVSMPSSSAGSDAAELTRALWTQHLQSAMAGDIDAATNDFAEDAVLFTKGHTFTGREEIRAYVAEVVNAMSPEAKESMSVDSEVYTGDTIFFNYTVGAWKMSGTNFLIVRDGKFVRGSSINYPAP